MAGKASPKIKYLLFKFGHTFQYLITLIITMMLKISDITIESPIINNFRKSYEG